MHSTQEIIAEASDLPVEDRIAVVDSLPRRFNRVDPEIEKAWGKEAERRPADLRAGRVKAIPGDQILRELQERFAQ